MFISHIALWTQDLEIIKDFYVKYFGGTSNQKYVNPAKGFESYFISFSQGPSLEIMRRTDITKNPQAELLGYCHIAFKLGSKEAVINLTEQLHKDGYQVLGQPRTTGDGYFESIIADPCGNRVELVA